VTSIVKNIFVHLVLPAFVSQQLQPSLGTTADLYSTQVSFTSHTQTC